MAYTARLTKQQLRQRRDATRDRSRDNTKGTVQYLVTYAYTNNNCLLCASNIIVSVAIPTRTLILIYLNCTCLVIYITNLYRRKISTFFLSKDENLVKKRHQLLCMRRQYDVS